MSPVRRPAGFLPARPAPFAIRPTAGGAAGADVVQADPVVGATPTKQATDEVRDPRTDPVPDTSQRPRGTLAFRGIDTFRSPSGDPVAFTLEIDGERLKANPVFEPRGEPPTPTLVGYDIPVEFGEHDVVIVPYGAWRPIRKRVVLDDSVGRAEVQLLGEMLRATAPPPPPPQEGIPLWAVFAAAALAAAIGYYATKE